MTEEERKSLNETRENMFQIKNKLNDIIDLLKGDEFGGSQGIVSNMKDQEARIKKLENFRDRTIWTIGGLSIPSGYGLWEVLRKIFNG